MDGRVISALLLLGVLAEIASWIVVLLAGCMSQRRKTCCQRHSQNEQKWRTGNAGHFAAGDYFIALIILTNTGGGNNMSFLIAWR